MWYAVDDDNFIMGFCTISMEGNTGWIFSPDIISEPIETDDGEAIYMMVDNHVIKRV